MNFKDFWKNGQTVEKQNNPFAICTASVGRDSPKYEQCVMDLKRKFGIHKDATEKGLFGPSPISFEVEFELTDKDGAVFSQKYVIEAESKVSAMEKAKAMLDEVGEYSRSHSITDVKVVSMAEKSMNKSFSHFWKDLMSTDTRTSRFEPIKELKPAPDGYDRRGQEEKSMEKDSSSEKLVFNEIKRRVRMGMRSDDIFLDLERRAEEVGVNQDKLRAMIESEMSEEKSMEKGRKKKLSAFKMMWAEKTKKRMTGRYEPKKKPKEEGVDMIPWMREQAAQGKKPLDLVTHIEGKPIKPKEPTQKAIPPEMKETIEWEVVQRGEVIHSGFLSADDAVRWLTAHVPEDFQQDLEVQPKKVNKMEKKYVVKQGPDETWRVIDNKTGFQEGEYEGKPEADEAAKELNRQLNTEKMGVEGAGPVPNSLLARQDLEGRKRKEKSMSFGINVENNIRDFYHAGMSTRKIAEEVARFLNVDDEDEINELEDDVADFINENKNESWFNKSMEKSQWTRLASTDEQEQAITELENRYKIVGGTTVGKAPQSVILDLTYQGGEIHISRDGYVEIDPEDKNNPKFRKSMSSKDQFVARVSVFVYDTIDRGYVRVASKAGIRKVALSALRTLDEEKKYVNEYDRMADSIATDVAGSMDINKSMEKSLLADLAAKAEEVDSKTESKGLIDRIKAAQLKNQKFNIKTRKSFNTLKDVLNHER